MTKEQPKSLMRCIGEFAGHIMHGVRTPVGPKTETIRHETHESTQGDVVLRRTVIEEVEMPAETAAKDADTCS